MPEPTAPTCELPEWRSTRKGRRCGQTCVDEQSGKRRFRWVSGQECGEKPRTRPEDVIEFAGGTPSLAEYTAELLGVPLERVERLEPMPLIPLVGLADGVEKRRRR
jgi:hypothetical protein